MKLTNIIWENIDKRKAAIAVLVYDNKVLVVKRSEDSYTNAGKWGFPGGGIDEGETPLEAVKRECEEEIGVRPIRVKKLAQNERITWFRGMLPCDPLECIDLDYSEHDEWMLVDISDMYEYEMIAGMREIIVKVLKREEQ